MKSSASITNIVPALLKAQKSMGSAIKGAKNPFFKSSYADYGSVLEASKDPLNDNGILILQPHVFKEGKNFVETTLLHETGEYLSSETEVVCAKVNDPQAFGSAITYARRYGLQSLIALPADDDDGEKAMSRPSKNTSTWGASVDVSATAKAAVAKVVSGANQTDPAVSAAIAVGATNAASVTEIPRRSWKRPATKESTPVASVSNGVAKTEEY